MANEIQMPDFYGSWTKARENGRQRMLGEQVQQVMPDALSGKQDALKRLLGLDANTGMQVQQHASAQRKAQADALNDQLAQTSALMANGGEQMAAQLYPQWRDLVHQAIPNVQLPEQFEPGAMQAIQHFAGIKNEQYTLSPGSARYDGSGKLIAQQPVTDKPDYQWDTERGVWIPKPGYAGQGPMPAPTSGAGPQMMGNALDSAVMSVESGGNPNAISPKGALGTMQTMPGTLRDPGFGVQPARDGSPGEQERVGKDYLHAMLQKYADPRLALAAYNAGPGTVDAALRAAGGNPEAALTRLPAETRAYVPKVLGRAQGGAQAPSGGLAAIPVAGIAPKQKKEVRMLTPNEVRQYGYRPGSIVQIDSEGKHQVVQAPPESKDASVGRPLPVNAVNKLTEKAGRLQNLNELASSFDDRFASHTVLGDTSNTLGRLGLPGGDKNQAEWWQQYDRMKNQVRNELFGASLTPSEQRAFEASDITPAMSPAVVRKNLSLQAQLIQRGLQREGSVWAKQGYNRDAIEAAIGVPMGTPAAAPAVSKPAASAWSVKRVK